MQYVETPLNPIFRWVGGKQRLLNRLLPLLPDDLNTRLYVEPFLGGGTLFLSTRPNQARLNDANPDLVHCYEYIRDNPAAVHRQLTLLKDLNFSDEYYVIRESYNRSGWSYKKAAHFIFLNRTCFNGIYRVNQRSEFNVPFGFKDNPRFPTLDELRKLSEAFGAATLSTGDFSTVLKRLPRKSFVYLDPPYPALNGTAYFTHYTDDRFSPDDQLELAEWAQKLHRRGILFMMTNASTPLIRNAFADFRIDTLNVPRWVSCKGTKMRVDELVIRNY